MVRVDPASLAEIVFRCVRIELVKRQIVFTTDEIDLIQVNRHRNSTPHSAVGTTTPADRAEPIHKSQPEPHCPTMARRAVQFHFAHLGSTRCLPAEH